MNLYLVTCHSVTYSETYDIYVIAKDYTTAGEMAITEVRKLDYRYTAGVNNIKYIASTENIYSKGKLLVMRDANERYPKIK